MIIGSVFGVVGIILIGLLAAPMRERTTLPTAIGFFYFGSYAQLDPALFKSAYVRVALDWNEFEPRQGEFIWSPHNAQAQKIDALLGEGKNVVPSIRSKSTWAVPMTDAKCAAAPRDLDTHTALQPGVSYSATYYAFIRSLAEHYRGKFKIVVVENEMNDPDFWCASADDYLRLFLTAQTAFKDVDPEIKLTDGGIQGAALNWLVIEDYLKNNDTVAALSFYKSFSGYTIRQEDLMTEMKKHTRKESVIRARHFFNSQLFDWVDLTNFHYYQQSDALPEVVAYLKKNIPLHKTLMTNEVGIKEKFSHSPDAAAQEMVKKYASLLALQVRPIIWFSPGGKEDNNAGALVEERGQIVVPTKNSLEAVARFLGKPDLSCHDRSTPAMASFVCRYPTEKVEVTWRKDEQSTHTIKLENGCSAYTYQNEPIARAEILLDTAPVFIVCR